ncbi:diiron oxygenase [Sorangium sp. So ce1182]|uniref:diiron oxygenase n=1 Tax=Sorangium sp. So ce1182 TaxID=3133334 RepID=UPI003F5E1591
MEAAEHTNIGAADPPAVSGTERSGHMERWYSRASVRRSPRRVLADLDPEHGLPFTPELVPIVAHPEVVRRGPMMIHRILTRALGDHLRFTEELENEVVVPVAQRIQSGAIFPWLEPPARIDAGRICVDEAYHSLFSRDVLSQLERLTGVRCSITSATSLERLDARARRAPPQMRPLVSAFYTIASEVVVSGILRTTPIDRRVAPIVRQVIADHLRDEAAHQAYFSAIFPEAWSHLGAEERDFIGPSLAEFVTWFFEPKYAAMMGWLMAEGLEAGTVRKIMEDVMEHEGEQEPLRHRGAAPLLHVLRSGDAFAHAATADAFSRCESFARRRSVEIRHDRR